MNRQRLRDAFLQTLDDLPPMGQVRGKHHYRVQAESLQHLGEDGIGVVHAQLARDRLQPLGVLVRQAGQLHVVHGGQLPGQRYSPVTDADDAESNLHTCPPQ